MIAHINGIASRISKSHIYKTAKDFLDDDLVKRTADVGTSVLFVASKDFKGKYFLAKNSYGICKNITSLVSSIKERDAQKAASSSFFLLVDTACLVVSLSSSRFKGVFFCSVALGFRVYGLGVSVYKREYDKLNMQLYKIGANTLELAARIVLAPELVVAALVADVALNSFYAVKNYRAGKNIELFGDIVVIGLRIHKETENIQAVFNRIYFSFESKEVEMPDESSKPAEKSQAKKNRRKFSRKRFGSRSHKLFAGHKKMRKSKMTACRTH